MPQALDAGGGTHFSFAAPVAGKSHAPGGREEYGTWIQKVRGSYGYYFSGSSDLKQGAGRKLGGAAGNRRGPSMEGGKPKGVPGRPAVERLGGGASPVPAGEKARPPRLVPALYPRSPSQAMARYRQEMMELVRGVPESSYELSLRDLVELPRREAPREEEEEDAGKERGGGRPDRVVATGRDKKVKGWKKSIPRSTSMDGGVFLLKMFFPPSLGWRRRRSSSSGDGAKVSPKPVIIAEGEKRRPQKEVDAEWQLEGCGDMSTRDETKNSDQRRKAVGCYPFFIKHRQKPI